MKRTQIHLAQSQVDMLKRLADATDMTLSDLVRQAIDQFLGSSVQLSQLFEFPEGEIRVLSGKLYILTPKDED